MKVSIARLEAHVVRGHSDMGSKGKKALAVCLKGQAAAPRFFLQIYTIIYLTK